MPVTVIFTITPSRSYIRPSRFLNLPLICLILSLIWWTNLVWWPITPFSILTTSHKHGPALQSKSSFHPDFVHYGYVAINPFLKFTIEIFHDCINFMWLIQLLAKNVKLFGQFVNFYFMFWNNRVLHNRFEFGNFRILAFYRWLFYRN